MVSSVTVLALLADKEIAELMDVPLGEEIGRFGLDATPAPSISPEGYVHTNVECDCLACFSCPKTRRNKVTIYTVAVLRTHIHGLP